MKPAALPRFRACPTASGFTLIEVVISSALMAMIIVSAYLVFNAGIASQKILAPRLEVIQNARVAMGLITADLRAACPLDKDIEFLGTDRSMGELPADSIDFGTHNYTPRHPGEGDFCQTSFFLDLNPETGQLSLYRRRNPKIAVDPLSGGRKEEIATGVLALQFEYYDGLDWYSTWGDANGKQKQQNSRASQPSRQQQASNLTGMPDAVRITLWFDANPRPKTASTLENPSENTTTEQPMMFQTVARLNLASVAQPASASGSEPTGSSDAGGQTSPTQQGGGVTQ